MTAPDEAPWPAIGVAVRGVVARADGRILLLRRAPDLHTDPGSWELPGGKLDYGETAQDALAREIREECGLVVTVAQPLSVTNFGKEPFWVTSLTFACAHVDGDVVLSEENDDFAWIGLDEIPTLRYARTIREQLDRYTEMVVPGRSADDGCR